MEQYYEASPITRAKENFRHGLRKFLLLWLATIGVLWIYAGAQTDGIELFVFAYAFVALPLTGIAWIAYRVIRFAVGSI